MSADTVSVDEFVVTSKRGNIIFCEGCAGFSDSIVSVSEESSSNPQGCCVHTSTLPLVAAVLAHVTDSINKTVFVDFVLSELEINDSIIELKRWGHFRRHLVVVPPRIALTENVTRFSVCSVTYDNEGNTYSVYCDAVRCKRGKNKKVNNKTLQTQTQFCCHLKQLIDLLAQDPKRASDTINNHPLEITVTESGAISFHFETCYAFIFTCEFIQYRLCIHFNKRIFKWRGYNRRKFVGKRKDPRGIL